jgi:hypothetical protein
MSTCINLAFFSNFDRQIEFHSSVFGFLFDAKADPSAKVAVMPLPHP